MPTPATIKLIVALLADIEIPILSRLCGGRITLGFTAGTLVGALGCGFLIASFVFLLIAIYA